jgi:hypothetical protein
MRRTIPLAFLGGAKPWILKASSEIAIEVNYLISVSTISLSILVSNTEVSRVPDSSIVQACKEDLVFFFPFI